MFDKFKKQGDSSVQKSQDRVGGFVPIPSGIYEAVIKQLWFGEYGSGAAYMDLQLEAAGKTFRERILLSDRNGNNFWTKDGKSTFFDGFMALDAICLFLTGEDFAANMENIEQKMVKVYNAEQKKEVPTEVPVLANVLGETIKVAILQRTVDVTKKGDDGQYHPTGETRDENTLSKVLDMDTNRTVTEIIDEVESPVYADAWLARWEGKVSNEAKGAKAGAGGTAGKPAASGGSKGRGSGMFGKK
jgi:hypothetical protein